jgi:uncharacterized cupredoxin-like copper-binding protein
VAAARLSRPSTPAEERTVLTVAERDFHISAPAHAPSGDLRLRVQNRGPDRHELIVVRRSDERPLPLRADGLTLDEDKLEPQTVGVLESREPNSVSDLDVHLDPGRYELFCNMSGHYLGGMHTDVVVR